MGNDGLYWLWGPVGITCEEGTRSVKKKPENLKAAHERMKMRTISNACFRLHSSAFFSYSLQQFVGVHTITS